MAKQVINLGTMADNKSGDPLRTAFTKINENFDELYANEAANNIDLTAVSTDIIPTSSETYDLGSPTNRFKDLYLSGNTIDLGGIQISADQYGKIILPGVTKKIVWASTLDDQRTEEDIYFNEIPLWPEGNPDNLNPESFFIVDQVFYQLVYNAADWGIARSEYLIPYRYDLTEDGFISDIYVDGYDYPEAATESIDFAELNSGQMWVIPAVYNGQPVDPADTQTMWAIFDDLESGAQVLKAGIISDFEASVPQVNFYDLQDMPNIPQDVADLSDNENLLGGVSSYNDLTDKPTIPQDVTDLTDNTGILSRSVNVPASSLGSPGDKVGDHAADGDYFYYCIQSYGGYQAVLRGGYSGPMPILYQGDYPQPESGWQFEYLGTTYTVSNSGQLNPGEWYISIDGNISVGSDTTITIGPPAVDNIWKRVALSSDTW